MLYWSHLLITKGVKASADLLYVMELSLVFRHSFSAAEHLDLCPHLKTQGYIFSWFQWGRPKYSNLWQEYREPLVSFGFCWSFNCWGCCHFYDDWRSDSQQWDIPQSSCVQGCSRCVVNLPAAPGILKPCLQQPAGQCWEKGSLQLRTASWLQLPP